MHVRIVQWRIWLVAAVLSVAMLLLAGRLCSLHLGDAEPVQRPWESKVLARRGTIYDRNGWNNPMAVTFIYHQPFLDPKALRPKHTRLAVAALLHERLNVDTDLVLSAFANVSNRHQVLQVFADDRTCREIATNKHISGVGWEDVAVRKYPQGRRMSSVLGFINRELEAAGVAGIELNYNQQLKGVNGRIEGEKDAKGIEIPNRRTANIPPLHGNNIHLTLDNNIQYRVEAEVQQVAREFQSSGVWAIVEKVDTGEILAMASWPDFDPNEGFQYGQDLWRNLAICVNYEPGSTMKSFTIAAALNEGVITEQTRMDVGLGSWFYAGHTLHDHVKGVVATPEALAKSSNIFCARVGLMLGEQRLRAYQRGFGFGDRLGIDLPNEARGLLRAGRWGDLATSRIAIGQGVAVTGLQMLNGYCCLANDGRLMKPFVVSRVVNGQGEILFANQPQVIARPVRPEVAQAVRRMLIGVTEDGGTATKAKVIDYEVAGKTGTAQIPENGRYSSTEFWASFVGFLPVEKPVFGVLVVVERPHPLHMGGQVAAPVFARIAEATAKYLEIPATVAEPETPPVARGTPPPAPGRLP
jgi:cell division protein FtsI (penicillin-binding protein 3)